MQEPDVWSCPENDWRCVLPMSVLAVGLATVTMRFHTGDATGLTLGGQDSDSACEKCASSSDPSPAESCSTCVRRAQGAGPALREHRAVPGRSSAVSDLANGRADTVPRMDVDRIWSAAELEALTPDDRAAAIRAGFVNDPANVPADLIDRARRKADARIAAIEGRQARQ